MRELSERYQREAKAGRLGYQACGTCGHRQVFPRPFCARCGQTKLEWQTAVGPGTVAAVSIVHRAPTPEYKARVPYAIVLVDMEEGFRLMGHGPLDLSPGDRVTVSTRAVDGRPFVSFARADHLP